MEPRGTISNGDGHGGTPLPRSDESDLCSHCGSCCDGTLFTHAPLTDRDVEQFTGIVRISTTSVGPVLPLGCGHHTGHGCDIFPNRPSICGTFKCRTLDELSHGHVSFAEALARVRELREIVDRLTSEYGKPPHGVVLERWVAANVATDEQLRRAKGDFAMIRYLESTHFSGRLAGSPPHD